MHPYEHAKRSAQLFGGLPEDYVKIHNWFDATKAHFGDWRHRALRHHSEGIFECESHFGMLITNSDGKQIPVRYIGEEHVKEDCGGIIPSIKDWLIQIVRQPWMAQGYRVDSNDFPSGTP